ITTTSTYTYDKKCRIKTISISNGSTRTYTFSPFGKPTSVTLVINDPPNPTTTIIYTLNSQGLVSSDNRGTIYSYDGNGYLFQAVYSSFTVTDTVTGGNVTVQTRTGANPATYTFTYSNILDSF